ncbi:hypothetical protein L207DRAFT_339361 [Hyaloscypha variabilis F]|jgi:hypothetical protein|uniref:Uncharacterized protein n=1 Tax=Hyaloscypha variabilis (strain UAMH 11265 / GT02V1 / F) TaxID=1149755 RepID=A0A2J6RPQ6_HYAVF|nr:hypothetical protein L207DRAFT_339361 [Hyaloscypha variabilis F]
MPPVNAFPILLSFSSIDTQQRIFQTQMQNNPNSKSLFAKINIFLLLLIICILLLRISFWCFTKALDFLAPSCEETLADGTEIKMPVRGGSVGVLNRSRILPFPI